MRNRNEKGGPVGDLWRSGGAPLPSRFSRLRVTPAALRSRPPPVQDVTHDDAIKKGHEGVRFSSVPSVAVPSRGRDPVESEGFGDGLLLNLARMLMPMDYRAGLFRLVLPGLDRR